MYYLIVFGKGDYHTLIIDFYCELSVAVKKAKQLLLATDGVNYMFSVARIRRLDEENKFYDISYTGEGYKITTYNLKDLKDE